MANYVLLERIELNASAASVTFDNIPQTGYTDLKVVVSARTDRASVQDIMLLSFNGSTTSFSSRYLEGNGSSAGSYTDQPRGFGNADGATATASTFGNTELYIPNYAGSANKSWSGDGVNETNATAAFSSLFAGLWSNTAAITSITLTGNSSNFVQYSTFSLYGLAAVGTTPAIAPKASGGNIQTDGTYWYHTFLASGTFTPQTTLICDYLVVAGGGGGGARATQRSGGGGGAGGLRSTVTATGGGGTLESSLSLTAQAYTVTVGAGGAATGTYAAGNNGSDSVFSTITSTGGGGGGYDAGLAGGSGGGGAGGGSSQLGGVGTANQGFDGALSTAGVSPAFAGGGGGGANAVGGVPTSTVGGAGGAGVTTSISGTSTVYAGGGGGGAYTGYTAGNGGTGGGGAGKAGTGNGVAGTTNLGAGGGGGGAEYGDNGGSGIVIIRYTIA